MKTSLLGNKSDRGLGKFIQLLAVLIFCGCILLAVQKEPNEISVGSGGNTAKPASPTAASGASASAASAPAPAAAASAASGPKPFTITDQEVPYTGNDGKQTRGKAVHRLTEILGAKAAEFIKAFNEIGESTEEAKFRESYITLLRSYGQYLSTGDKILALWSGGNPDGTLPTFAKKMGFQTLDGVPFGEIICNIFGFENYNVYEPKHRDAFFEAVSAAFAEVASPTKPFAVFLAQFKPSSVVFCTELPAAIEKGATEIVFIGADPKMDLSTAQSTAPAPDTKVIGTAPLAENDKAAPVDNVFDSVADLKGKILWTFKFKPETFKKPKLDVADILQFMEGALKGPLSKSIPTKESARRLLGTCKLKPNYEKRFGRKSGK